MKTLSSHKKNTQTGFTIIEVMIAMAIFTILVTIGIGSVLNAMQQHKSSENTRTVMDNLNFVMEDMARNIRLGQNIHCFVAGEAAPSFASDTDPVVPQDCALPTDAHNQIMFNDQNGQHVMYVISVPSTTGGAGSGVYKQKGDDPTKAQLISPPQVVMDFYRSGFTVQGAPAGDGAQPTVLIRLAGTVTHKGIESKFAIETTVTLRALDS
jgi:prepilin-type N-terminal cleavage/methylation domain-containing protein